MCRTKRGIRPNSVVFLPDLHMFSLLLPGKESNQHRAERHLGRQMAADLCRQVRRGETVNLDAWSAQSAPAAGAMALDIGVKGLDALF